MEPTYKIIRFFRDPDVDNYVVLDGLTLEEAQAHCSREDTHDMEAGWFDGYEQEDEEESLPYEGTGFATCPACRGTGGGVYNDCAACDGNGVV